MKKVDAFSKVLDSLNDNNTDKLLISAKVLIKAQKVVRLNSAKRKSSNKQKSNAIKNNTK